MACKRMTARITNRQPLTFCFHDGNRYITSDCNAILFIYYAQRYAKSPEEAVADVLKAGMKHSEPH